MILGIGSLFGGGSGKKEISHDHIAAALKILEKKPNEPAHYKWTRKVADSYKLPKNHEIYQKLHSYQSKDLREKVDQPRENIPKSSAYLTQKGMTPEEFIPIVQQFGDQASSIEVIEGSDELFQTIKEYCPNLNTFVFNESASSPSFELTDAGLGFIAQMPNLTKIDFNAYLLFNITSKGLENFILNSQFQNNLVQLTVNSAAFDDSCYSALCKYAKLETLELHTAPLHYKTLTSYPLPTSITTFILDVGEVPKNLITDAFLNILPPNLTKLSINASFKEVSASGFTSALKRLSKLCELSIDGTPIQRFMLDAIKQMLRRLSLGDCHLLQPFDFVDLFKAQTQLVDLSLGHFAGLEPIYPFPSTLEKLYLEAPCLKSLSSIPSTLKELTLSGIELCFLDFKQALSQFSNLESLSIYNCPWFNRESLEGVAENLSDKLTKIALIGTSVDDIALAGLALFSRLHTVALGNLKATTKIGLMKFLGDDRVAARTRNLFFCDLDVTNDLAGFFTSFENLRVLFIGNALMGIPGPQDIFKNETFIRNRTECVDWYGPNLYSKFLSEI